FSLARRPRRLRSSGRPGIRLAEHLDGDTEIMLARTPRLVNPQSVVSCLAGLKGNSPLGLPPLIPSDPNAHDKAQLALRERAQRALHDLRSIALCHLDKEFIAAIRPSHPDAAAIFDAGIDAMGYAAFFQSKYQEYPGIHINLDALHQYL